ncbi:hypothetical protein PT282_04730 [Bifidobacterium sp. ESL0763]|uniref:hypothetical protein n=1 Tax=Bifidobacterium sp. ESL0763 TaxID=2983227 RepID=UPI0023FA409C|nr:hypothetical protein [Bifidobacterium sp. ESL0763]MDF7663967.1 hypothetical protein [Bifidobacterium sp. ESL0763]
MAIILTTGARGLYTRLVILSCTAHLPRHYWQKRLSDESRKKPYETPVKRFTFITIERWRQGDPDNATDAVHGSWHPTETDPKNRRHRHEITMLGYVIETIHM